MKWFKGIIVFFYLINWIPPAIYCDYGELCKAPKEIKFSFLENFVKVRTGNLLDS